MAETKIARKGYLSQLSSRVGGSAQDVMKTWKAGAKRADLVGEVSYRSLEMVHGGLGVATRSLARLERATQPPARTAKSVEAHEPHRHGTTREMPKAKGSAS